MITSAATLAFFESVFANTPALRERPETDLAQALADLDGAQLRLD
jgi:5-enolpyruvylshikimate-3-phosphate synthase